MLRYEPTRESRFINVVKNNSTLRKKERKREKEREYEGSTRAEEVHWHHRARPFIYTDRAHFTSSRRKGHITQCNKRLCAALVPVRTRYNDLQDVIQSARKFIKKSLKTVHTGPESSNKNKLFSGEDPCTSPRELK